jgi:hypothetical protein
MHDSGCKVQDARCRMQGARCGVRALSCRSHRLRKSGNRLPLRCPPSVCPSRFAEPEPPSSARFRTSQARLPADVLPDSEDSVGEWREQGTTGGNRDPLASPSRPRRESGSAGQRKSRSTRTATRRIQVKRLVNNFQNDLCAPPATPSACISGPSGEERSADRRGGNADGRRGGCFSPEMGFRRSFMVYEGGRR